MRILILGAGFSGLWAAIGAARQLNEIGTVDRVEILVVDRNSYHSIRVRNYESDLSDVTVPLQEVLDPIGVGHIVGEISSVDTNGQEVAVATPAGQHILSYDRLVLALGSKMPRPTVPGLEDISFDVDTYAEALRLDKHLAELPQGPPSPSRSTIVVVGAGFTGIEVATELSGRVARLGLPDPRIMLIDSKPVVGATIGADARPVISNALADSRIETRFGTKVSAALGEGISLSSGEFIPTMTVIWCCGMIANPLAATIPAKRDEYGRISVDEYMQVTGIPNVFAAGDVAVSAIDGAHPTVMSCQFARPMGRFAGHNVVASLFGQPMLPLHIDWYVTVLDLGNWGALYTAGWDRQVRLTGAAAKVVKTTINRQRIYPPRTRNRAEILAAGAPTVQAPPPEARLGTPSRPGA